MQGNIDYVRGDLPIEPERRGGVNLEVNEEFTADVLRIELIESGIESTIIGAWFSKARLGD